MRELLGVFCAILCLGLQAKAQESPSVGQRALDPPAWQDPIGSVGHGSVRAPDGTPLDLSPELIDEISQQYIDRLTAEATSETRQEYDRVVERLRTLMDERDPDGLLSRSVMIDWLADRVQPDDWGRLRSNNRSLRVWHIERLSAEGVVEPPTNYWMVPDWLLEFAREQGLFPTASTSAGGLAYLQQCRESGISPLPHWGTDGWVHQGELEVNFMPGAGVAQVFTFESSDEPGTICYALPRITGGTINLLGVICMDRQSGNTCFWDQAGVDIGAVVPFAEFVGGADLLGGAGVCSDCHAGENPFVIHPGTSLDLGNATKSPTWHVPLVHPSWPQNPGPTELLDLLPLPAGQASCQSCHTAAIAGRFPEVGALPGFCDSVLEPAIGRSSGINRTMPSMNLDPDLFAVHESALIAFCGQSPPGGSTVPSDPFGEDPDYVSPPIVVGPLYGCASAVEVRGAALDAEVQVFIDDGFVASEIVREPSRTVVTVPQLQVGQVVTAVQTADSVTSDVSAPVTVRDHAEDFPEGLPTPALDPDIVFQCGHVVTVRHPRGADITVLSNGSDPVSMATGTDWTDIRPGKSPFEIGDSFTARYQFCADVSPLSGAVDAVAAPAETPIPQIDPPEVFIGQELISVRELLNGALTRVGVSTLGSPIDPDTEAVFSTGVTWRPEVDFATPLGRSLEADDLVDVRTTLCEGNVTRTGPLNCEALPAPVLQQPFVGQSQVIMTSTVPGATITIYDQIPTEIAHGSGVQIALRRALVANDVITAVQTIGECRSATGHQVAVLCPLEDDGQPSC